MAYFFNLPSMWSIFDRLREGVGGFSCGLKGDPPFPAELAGMLSDLRQGRSESRQSGAGDFTLGEGGGKKFKKCGGGYPVLVEEGICLVRKASYDR